MRRDSRPKGYRSQRVGGLPGGAGERPVVTPIYPASTYRFPTTRRLAEVAGGERGGYFYSRYTNPNSRAVEAALAALEGTEDALVFASGMAAAACTALTFVKAGERLVAFRDLYGGTSGLFEMLRDFGVGVAFVETGDYRTLGREARGARLVWFESPTNPLCKVVDFAKVAQVGKQAGAITAIDATFGSPFNQKPARFGIDLVMHSATKYLGGHSDLTAGTVAGRRALTERIEKTRRHLGGVLDPQACWILERSLKTLDVRMERINASALAVARFLRRSNKVAAVHYPGLPSHPEHSLARRQMKGFGGMMSFEIRGGDGAAFRFADRLRVVSLAASLGGVESLVSHPVLTSHRLSPEERLRFGIRPGLVRLSVGIEPKETLIEDLRKALEGR